MLLYFFKSFERFQAKQINIQTTILAQILAKELLYS